MRISKRHAGIAIGVAALVLGTWLVMYARDERLRIKREQQYQAKLAEYSAAIEPGMQRQAVERYLASHNQSFQKSCCGEVKNYDELVKIGQEPAPWYCSENNVYIAFVFLPNGREPVRDDPSDVLKRVTLFRQLEGCL